MGSELFLTATREHEEAGRRDRGRSAKHVTDPVLVLSHERDYAADSVIARLNARNVPLTRWNIETLVNCVPTWAPGDTHAFRSVWLRDYLPPQPETPTIDELDDYLVVRAQWRDWVATLADQSTFWINPLWPARKAENKAVQLATATEIGMLVPATIVTNDRDCARAFEREQRDGAVVKTMAPGYFAYTDRSFMFTTEVTDDVLADAHAWRTQPLIVQQRIPRARDIRVIVVGDYMVAAATTTGDQDWRLTVPTIWHQIEISDRLANECRALIRKLGLIYAAIDLVDDGERLWFLEANQAGEFQFLDRPLRLGVADVLADALARGSEP
jgi:glutathione synthase/RimK-type ligase-like ATP-grasp enzyme